MRGTVDVLAILVPEVDGDESASALLTTTMLHQKEVIEALKEAPDQNFQRWLSNLVDLWSMRKLEWKQDGSDLMDEAEIYYLEAIINGLKIHRYQSAIWSFEQASHQLHFRVSDF